MKKMTPKTKQAVQATQALLSDADELMAEAKAVMAQSIKDVEVIEKEVAAQNAAADANIQSVVQAMDERAAKLSLALA